MVGLVAIAVTLLGGAPGTDQTIFRFDFFIINHHFLILYLQKKGGNVYIFFISLARNHKLMDGFGLIHENETKNINHKIS